MNLWDPEKFANHQDQKMKDEERLERLEAIQQEETQYQIWRLSREKTEEDFLKNERRKKSRKADEQFLGL